MDARPWNMRGTTEGLNIENAAEFSELIDDTRGILLGDTAKKYNQLISDLLYQLNTLNKDGALLAIHNGEKDTEAERLRIALTTGELYKRRRATAYARRTETLLRRYANAIEDQLNEATKGREGINQDELDAENEIVKFEQKIYKELKGFMWAPLRPGETDEERHAEYNAIHHRGRGPLFPSLP